MIKTLRANHTQYHFKKEIFDKLPVDQMRWIFENRLADQEIPGLPTTPTGSLAMMTIRAPSKATVRFVP